MAIETRAKTWVEDEILTADALNAEFDNIITTGDQLIGTPRSTSFDMNGQQILMDDNQNTSISASVDDRIDFKIGGGVGIFRFDGTVVTPVNGLDFVAGDTENDVEIQVTSASDTDVDVNVVPLGAGNLKVDGVAVNFLTYQVF